MLTVSGVGTAVVGGCFALLLMLLFKLVWKPWRLVVYYRSQGIPGEPFGASVQLPVRSLQHMRVFTASPRWSSCAKPGPRMHSWLTRGFDRPRCTPS